MLCHRGQQFVSLKAKKHRSLSSAEVFTIITPKFHDEFANRYNMAPDCPVNSLPPEIVDQILGNENIQINDVMNFALTCKRFYWTVITCNKLWKTKFFQRWPLLQEEFENQKAIVHYQYQRPVWFEETKSRIMCRRKLMEKLDQMLNNHYRKMELGPYDLREYDALFLPECGADPMNYHCLVDELIRLVQHPVDDCNLTHQFYANYVLGYLRQKYLAKEWNAFLALPAKRRLTENGAILVSQWNQPTKRISAKKLTKTLDDLTRETRALVAERYPGNPLNRVTPEELLRWKVENLDDNVWSSEHSWEIVRTLCEVMFKKYGFNSSSLMVFVPTKNSFIDQVLKNRTGTPIALGIILESVARRLGLRTEHVCVVQDGLLRWKPRYIIGENEKVENFYFDVFNLEELLSRNRWPERTGIGSHPIEDFNDQEAMSPEKALYLMASNISQSERQSTQYNGRAVRLMTTLHLLYLMDPARDMTVFQVINFYTSQDMDISEYLDSFKHALRGGRYQPEYARAQIDVFLNGDAIRMKRIQELSTAPTQKARTPDVKYAIGMIMKDPQHMLCVIVDWDTKLNEQCKFKIHDKPNHHTLEVQPQPYYHVYNDDGSCRYLPQEQLFLCPSPNYVNHRELGRHFYKYMGSYYMPNYLKAFEYPEDLELLAQLQCIKDRIASKSAS